MFVVKIVLQETEPYLVRAIQHHSIMEDIEKRKKDRQQISRWSSVVNIDHFTLECLVAWSLNESEAGVDLVLIEISLLFLCKLA